MPLRANKVDYRTSICIKLPRGLGNKSIRDFYRDVRVRQCDVDGASIKASDQIAEGEEKFELKMCPFIIVLFGREFASVRFTRLAHELAPVTFCNRRSRRARKRMYYVFSCPGGH